MTNLNPKISWIIITVFILLVLGITGYYFYRYYKDNHSSVKDNSTITTNTDLNSQHFTDSHGAISFTFPKTWINDGFTDDNGAFSAAVKQQYNTVWGLGGELRAPEITKYPTGGAVEVAIWKFSSSAPDPKSFSKWNNLATHTIENEKTINGYSTFYTKDSGPQNANDTDYTYVISHDDIMVQFSFRAIDTSVSSDGKSIVSEKDYSKYLSDFESIVNSIKFNDQTNRTSSSIKSTPLIASTITVDMTGWKKYENIIYDITFQYPSNFSVVESERTFQDNMGTYCQNVKLNEKTNFNICDKADNLTSYGLREPNGMDPISIADLTIGNQPAKKYFSGNDGNVSYVVLSPDSNRIQLDSSDASSQNQAILEKILSTFKFN